MEELSMWERVYNALNSKGFDAYPPDAKEGECTSEYVVVKESGRTPIVGVSSQRVVYDIMLYVPRNHYERLAHFREEVQKAMHETLYPTLMYVGQQSIDYYDDEYKAHMTSIQYRNNVRNKFIREGSV